MSDFLSRADIDPRFNEHLTTQSYGGRRAIEGVKTVDLRQMVDDGGMFTEVLRLNDSAFSEAFPEFQARQCSFSVVLPNAIKAFHLHFRQDDVWFVPPTDRMLVGLVDARLGSPTVGESMRIVLGAGRTQLLFIPRGIAHGVVNQMPAPGSIFYFVNQQFDINDADERRLPYDLMGEEFWRMTPG